MKEKRHPVAGILFILLLLGLTLADVLGKDRYFSANENRILAQKPDFDWKSFRDGSFGREYEEYISDQFLGRDGWIMGRTYALLLSGRREVNGVYVLGDETLVESHPEAAGRDGGRLEKLAEDVRIWEQLPGVEDVKVMLAPTAGAVRREELPKYAPEFDQYGYLDRAGALLGDRLVDVREALEEQSGGSAYYRTDHHWTTPGAYAAYREWALAAGTLPVPLAAFDRQTASNRFLGTLHSKINIPVRPDTIELFIPLKERSYQVFYDMRETPEASLYQRKHLETKNKYGVFLDDNHGLVEIRTETPGGRLDDGAKAEKRLLVIKDSYANCFVPFLTEHYGTIFMADKRYYRGGMDELIKKYDITDIIVLYDVIHFMDNY